MHSKETRQTTAGSADKPNEGCRRLHELVDYCFLFVYFGFPSVPNGLRSQSHAVMHARDVCQSVVTAGLRTIRMGLQQNPTLLYSEK